MKMLRSEYSKPGRHLYAFYERDKWDEAQYTMCLQAHPDLLREQETGKWKTVARRIKLMWFDNLHARPKDQTSVLPLASFFVQNRS